MVALAARACHASSRVDETAHCPLRSGTLYRRSANMKCPPESEQRARAPVESRVGNAACSSAIRVAYPPPSFPSPSPLGALRFMSRRQCASRVLDRDSLCKALGRHENGGMVWKCLQPGRERGHFLGRVFSPLQPRIAGCQHSVPACRRRLCRYARSGQGRQGCTPITSRSRACRGTERPRLGLALPSSLALPH